MQKTQVCCRTGMQPISYRRRRHTLPDCTLIHRYGDCEGVLQETDSDWTKPSPTYPTREPTKSIV